MERFENFIRRRALAASAYLNGEPAPMLGLATEGLSATCFPPNGGAVLGAHEVRLRFERDSASFRYGRSEIELVAMGSSDTLGYWTGFYRATARLKGRDEEVSINLRVTEIFRREAGEWRLVHQHVDPLAPGPHEDSREDDSMPAMQEVA
ncbi:MAG: nuclear transport factor 2 family protein [Pseudomonadota bacterium]|jgi:Ketosteroid isomerase homolog|nr:MAG: DUF4440 domain-containing protein [Pseudomonadota bacterium]